MELHCPKCNSTDLKKVSLAYEEGLFHSKEKAGIRGVLVGSGGPDIVVGSAATKGAHQTALSNRLSPPKKWSYLKLIIAFAVVTFVALLVYVQSVMASSSVSSAVAVKLYALIASCFFVALVLLTLRHNRIAFTRKYAEWDRSVMCQRCGAVSVQD